MVANHFPSSASGKEHSLANARDIEILEFYPWVEDSPKKGIPPPGPAKEPTDRSLAGYSLWVAESDMTEQMPAHLAHVDYSKLIQSKVSKGKRHKG